MVFRMSLTYIPHIYPARADRRLWPGDPLELSLAMLSWKVAPAIVCGIVCVLKSSEMTPLTALKLAELVVEAGFAPGVRFDKSFSST